MRKVEFFFVVSGSKKIRSKISIDRLEAQPLRKITQIAQDRRLYYDAI